MDHLDKIRAYPSPAVVYDFFGWLQLPFLGLGKGVLAGSMSRWRTRLPLLRLRRAYDAARQRLGLRRPSAALVGAGYHPNTSPCPRRAPTHTLTPLQFVGSVWYFPPRTIRVIRVIRG